MTDQTQSGVKKRTAVLVVHGMGSQRPLETARGVVDAVWRDRKDQSESVWFHPELSGTDIDLTVQTTGYLPKERDASHAKVPGEPEPKSDRRVDFHELYWAHLISETRAIAVLLWLFELAKRGPYLKRGMRPLWWGGAIYLVFLILSVSFLSSQIIERLAKIEFERASMMITPIITLAILTGLCALWAARFESFWLSAWSFLFAVIASALLFAAWWLFRHYPHFLEGAATHFLPATFALLVTLLLMGRYGVTPWVWAYLISFLFHFIKLWVVDDITPFGLIWGDKFWRWYELVPWSLESEWSSTAAWLFLGSYVVLSAAILQPYLGDVARYLRNSPANIEGRRAIRRAAVSTLLGLHESGKYDRIIVVAHSLGTVVAYDMLRATFARMYRDMPAEAARNLPEFIAVNEGKLPNGDELPRAEWRHQARVLVRRLFELVENMRKKEPSVPHKAWLVTDFITLGSPLTHAHYLLCHGEKNLGAIKGQEELIQDFARRVREREFPTCRPKMHDGDKVLTYERRGKLYFHHAALFGLTRWTNLYFELEQLFWGDPISGPVASYDAHVRERPGDPKIVELFGHDIVDVAVSTLTSGGSKFVTHTAYWKVDHKNPPDRWSDDHDPDPPHIQALKLAINLADRPENEDPEEFRKIPGIKLTN